MTFALLHNSLVGHIKARVRNGECTERSVARLSGVSQSHMHNVLKGTRMFSPELADQVLKHLHIDLSELLEGPASDVSHRTHRASPLYRTVTMLEGYIGPEHPYPTETAHGGYPFLQAHLDGLGSPVAARLG